MAAHARVVDRVSRGGERTWRLADLQELPQSAAAKSLSRLAERGVLVRLGKGLYYRGRATAFGQSRPKPSELLALANENTRLFPAGVAAANLIGLSTQTPRRIEVSTAAMSVPGLLLGDEAVAHTRRPAAWNRLSDLEAAILEVLRDGGRTVDSAPDVAVERVRALLRGGNVFENLLRASVTEPPRVRALLGALGEVAGRNAGELARLRQSLHPLSRFDFGVFGGAATAAAWQVKKRRVA